ncbi:hypothetical protein ACFFON_00570 [Arthrobacter citreus]|uniref:hypothetical protein n=1 Tax=Arthrobacter TaxID=1663 RepID=UPI00126531B1|nr:hypothetical protein [Arthrobacter gandavensis]
MTLQWVAMGAAFFFALLRVPGALRGENRGMFYALLLLSAAMALSIPTFYLPVDSLLGGVNAANLLLRYLLFAVLLILGLKAAAAFQAPLAARLIGGIPGLLVLAAATVAVAVFYWLSDLPESSTALAAYWDQDTVHAYGDSSRLYQAYVSACLVPSLLGSAVAPRRPAGIRVSAGLLALGFATAVIHSVLSLAVVNLDLGVWDTVLPYSAIIVLCLGLGLMWNSHRLAKRHPKPGLLSRAYASR